MKFTFTHTSGQEETISAPHLGLAWKKLRAKSEHGKDKAGWSVKSDKEECVAVKAKGKTNWYVPKGLTPERIGLAGPPRVKRLKPRRAESIALSQHLLENCSTYDLPDYVKALTAEEWGHALANRTTMTIPAAQQLAQLPTEQLFNMSQQWPGSREAYPDGVMPSWVDKEDLIFLILDSWTSCGDGAMEQFPST